MVRKGGGRMPPPFVQASADGLDLAASKTAVVQQSLPACNHPAVRKGAGCKPSASYGRKDATEN